MGKGVIPYTHPSALWSVGLQQRDYISCGFARTDLVIAVGYDLIEYSPKKSQKSKALDCSIAEDLESPPA